MYTLFFEGGGDRSDAISSASARKRPDPRPSSETGVSVLEGEEVEVRVPISLRRKSVDLGMLHILTVCFHKLVKI